MQRYAGAAAGGCQCIFVDHGLSVVVACSITRVCLTAVSWWPFGACLRMLAMANKTDESGCASTVSTHMCTAGGGAHLFMGWLHASGTASLVMCSAMCWILSCSCPRAFVQFAVHVLGHFIVTLFITCHCCWSQCSLSSSSSRWWQLRDEWCELQAPYWTSVSISSSVNTVLTREKIFFTGDWWCSCSKACTESLYTGFEGFCSHKLETYGGVSSTYRVKPTLHPGRLSFILLFSIWGMTACLWLFRIAVCR